MKIDFVSQRMRVNNLNFAFNELGNGEPCLFIHGNRDRKEGFHPLFKFMLDKNKLIALDLRGHGDTDKPTQGYNYNQLINDILSFTNEKGYKSFNIVGHSLGGVLSMQMAINTPERINKMVLMGTNAWFKPKFKRPSQDELITKDKIHETNMRAAPFFFLPEYSEVRDEVLKNWSNIPPYIHSELIKMGHPDLRNDVSKITVPTLLLYGEKDMVCPPENGEFLQDKIKNSSLKIIDGTSHFMFMEKPLEVSKAILSFFNE